MGRALREIKFSVVVDKYEHWSAHHLAECEQTKSSYDDWVINQLESAMRIAGEQFIMMNPDLFAGELI